ncbi:hypothetical protein EGJ28_07620 [Stutzerimonas xanthomarina]|jgi:hypothetical protein|uniref:Uncharacterized protein n=1 Tax=Stutzerimonas xanthomarina TaxID=271420 RepID=A0A427EA50_9GAMM|nr:MULTISPECIES: hypothetical protein [Stutzerimonas]MCW8158376.1 hypothetical protein [Stutzerimonas stutzeri]RRV13466.1 hypothetical protein EGJ28_07620 [Stutzerimonas xanthomarina]
MLILLIVGFMAMASESANPPVWAGKDMDLHIRVFMVSSAYRLHRVVDYLPWYMPETYYSMMISVNGRLVVGAFNE